MEKIWNFLKDEDGLELTEYAIMGGLIVVLVVGTILALGGHIDRIFQAINAQLDTVR